jgi:hypothetical protein
MLVHWHEMFHPTLPEIPRGSDYSPEGYVFPAAIT